VICVVEWLNVLTDMIGLDDSIGGEWNGQAERDEGKKAMKNEGRKIKTENHGKQSSDAKRERNNGDVPKQDLVPNQ
jgi:hypothetical protein